MTGKINIITDENKIDELLSRGVIVNILPTQAVFKQQLLSGKKLKMYWGFDPTSTALHLSHAKNIILLEEFRKLGHEVHILFGDFTARIGDPTDKGSARKQLSQEDVTENVKAWIQQIKPLMDFSDTKNPPKIVYNSDWLKKLSFEEVIDIASNFTVQHMMERDMFEKRLHAGEPIFLHEFFYPLMQGYDSVAQDVDVEFCGTDQTFNALAGRTLQKRYNQKEKTVVAVNLMEDPVTKELMSKSNGNGVFLNATPEIMYGQIMAQNDSMIKPLLINVTRLPLQEIEVLDIIKDPMKNKKFTAFEITKIFFGEEKAMNAQKEWVQAFQKGGVPGSAKKVEIEAGILLMDILINNDLVASKTEFRRLIKEGAIRFYNKLKEEKVTDPETLILESVDLKIGKKRFLKIIVKKDK